MIIIADLHLKEDTESIIFDHVLPGVRAACEARGEFDVVILGDVFHIRYAINVRLQNRLRDVLKKWCADNIAVKILPGNHDQYNVAGRNALEVFNDIHGVRVYTRPQWDPTGLWIPYRKNLEDVQAALQLPRPKGCRGVLWVHQGIQGAWMNDGYKNNDGVPPSMLKDWKRVFSGHYHKQQIVENVIYIGSPYQTKADEAGQDKGYATWDGKRFDHVNRTWGPRYHNLEINNPGDIDLSGIDKDDIVRVKTGAGVNPEIIGQQLLNSGISRHVVIPKAEAPQVRLQVSDSAGLDEYVQAYVHLMSGDLDKRRLIQVWKELSNGLGAQQE